MCVSIRRFLAAAWVLAVGISGLALPSAADSDACRDWRVEHTEWKIEALQAFLRGRPRAAQEETIFEVLQREAYLTSCDPDLRVTRSERIGWRLVGRSADEYPVILTESVLAASGFDLRLQPLLEPTDGRDASRPRKRRGARAVALQERTGGAR